MFPHHHVLLRAARHPPGFVPPILEPDFDLGLGEAKVLGQTEPFIAGQVSKIDFYEISTQFFPNCFFNPIFSFQCPSGTYATGTGNTACTTCPAGSECSDPTVAPVACSAGTTSSAGATSCEACPAGQICAAGGAVVVCTVRRL